MADRLQHLHDMVQLLSTLRHTQRAALLDTVACVDALLHNAAVCSQRNAVEKITAIIAGLQEVVLANHMAVTMQRTGQHRQGPQEEVDSGSEFEDDVTPEHQQSSQPFSLRLHARPPSMRPSVYVGDTGVRGSRLSLVSGGSGRQSAPRGYRQSMY